MKGMIVSRMDFPRFFSRCFVEDEASVSLVPVLSKPGAFLVGDTQCSLYSGAPFYCSHNVWIW